MFRAMELDMTFHWMKFIMETLYILKNWLQYILENEKKNFLEISETFANCLQKIFQYILPLKFAAYLEFRWIEIAKNHYFPHSYVGKHLTPRGGVILKGLEGFRGGTQRVALYKGGNPKIWPILGGNPLILGGELT